MLKERRNQGTIALMVISLIFLAVAAVMGFIQYQKVNTKTAYDRNSNPGADSAVYAEVSYIFPEALIEVDDNTQVWLVAYQDGYVGLQAKKGDKQIAQLLEKEKKGERRGFGLFLLPLFYYLCALYRHLSFVIHH